MTRTVAILVLGAAGTALLSPRAAAQADWVHKSPVHVPPARTSPGMAQFTAPGGAPGSGVVMFGGTAADGFTALGDTWIWDGSDWTQITSFGQTGAGPHPPAANSPSMAYNPVTGHVVMFASGHTWILRRPGLCDPIVQFINGAFRVVSCIYSDAYYEWDLIAPSPTGNPSLRSGAAMDYDPNTKSVILTTGSGATLNFLNDTWSFIESGGSDFPGGAPPTGAWTFINVADAPSPRSGAAAAKCGPGTAAGPGPILLFGGNATPPINLASPPDIFQDTWLFSTAPGSFRWSGPFLPSTFPPPREFSAAAYYPQSGQAVLYGGDFPAGSGLSTPAPCTVFFSDTWGGSCGLIASWTQLAPAHNPGQRTLHGMATGPNGATVVMFGGAKSAPAACVTSDVISNETWVWGKIVACSPVAGANVPVGSDVSCHFDPSFDYAGHVTFAGWTANGFASPHSSEPAATFHAESPGSASITAHWSDANGSHSEVVSYTISHPH